MKAVLFIFTVYMLNVSFGAFAIDVNLPKLIQKFDGKRWYLSLSGYKPQYMSFNRTYPPDAFWKCPAGYLFRAEVMQADSIVSIRPEFSYPRQIVSLSVSPKPELGGVFILPWHHYSNEPVVAEDAAHIIFASMDELCHEGAKGENTGDTARENLLLTSDKISPGVGRFIYRAKGDLLLAFPNEGEYFAALWRHPAPKTGASFLICDSKDCKITPAYDQDRGFVYLSYKNKDIEVRFEERNWPSFNATVQSDRSVRIQ